MKTGKKKHGGVLVLAAVWLGLSLWAMPLAAEPVFAEGSPRLTFRTEAEPQTDLETGDEIEVTALVESDGSWTRYAMQNTISYDWSSFEYVDGSAELLAEGDGSTWNYTKEPVLQSGNGTFKIITYIFSTAGCETEESLPYFRFRLKVKEGAEPGTTTEIGNGASKATAYDASKLYPIREPKNAQLTIKKAQSGGDSGSSGGSDENGDSSGGSDGNGGSSGSGGGNSGGDSSGSGGSDNSGGNSGGDTSGDSGDSGGSSGSGDSSSGGSSGSGGSSSDSSGSSGGSGAGGSGSADSQGGQGTSGQPADSSGATTGGAAGGSASTGAAAFADVKGHWAQVAIETAAKAGLFSGYPDGGFHPEEAVSRAQLAQLLFSAAKADPKSVTASGRFTDIPKDEWYATAVEWAVSQGLASGTSAATFEPEEAVSRQDMAVMLARYAEKNNLKGGEAKRTQDFTDAAAIAEYAKEAVETLRRIGVVGGNPDGTFAPQSRITRAEAAVMLGTLLSL